MGDDPAKTLSTIYKYLFLERCKLLRVCREEWMSSVPYLDDEDWEDV